MTRPFDKGRVFCFVIVPVGNVSQSALLESWADEQNNGVNTPFGYIEKKYLHIPKVSRFCGYCIKIFLYIPKYSKNPMFE